ncbi:family 43 glycosylhydrolase [Labilibacter marinus]|uniref:family 43 glycosylhydrolase n=1 Tax=Labilibacter marinus TaxID=1477105 RepID=UPI00094F4F96|nr:family 43 glycosylhydrolase [Labilibacter marinus]
MKKNIFTYLFICVYLLSSACIQATNIKGTVKHAETMNPVPNVLITDVHKTISTRTDINGNFNLDISADNTFSLVFDNSLFIVQEKTFSLTDNSIEVLLIPRKTSAATARWRDYIETPKAYNQTRFVKNEGWGLQFEQAKLKGDFAVDTTMIRRDPSAVIKVGKTYYTYYTRGTRYRPGGEEKFFPWDECDVWYATSKDGWKWKEHGPAVERGVKGAFDDASVFTPEILAHNGMYYLVYQCVKNPYIHRVKNTVGMAVASSPDGPFKKLAQPILVPTNNGQWDKGDHDEVLKKGDFDSHKVHDPCLMFYNNKFYLYYKGERMGEEKMHGQREIKWGVAISESPTGPYIKSPCNPITNSGHEVCVWPYKGGIALIHTDDGPERHTIQWSPDGINFEIMGKINPHTPKAFGIFRTDNHDESPTEGIRWGLCHKYGGDHWRTGYNYIQRFDTKEKE